LNNSEQADANVGVEGGQFSELKSAAFASPANETITGREGVIASQQDPGVPSHNDEQSYLGDAVENCSELIGMADIEGHFTFANRAFIHTLGYSRKEEVIGKHIGALLADNPPALAQEISEKVLADGGWRGECLLSRRDGSSIPTLLSVGPVTDNEGRVIGSFGVGRDISDQKQAHEALQRSEEQFRELAENIREVFFTLNLNLLRVTYLSPAYEEIWGHLRQEVYDRASAWIDAIYPADREQAIRFFGQAQHRETAEHEYRIVRPDDSVRWISARASPVYDSEGKPCRVVGFAEDVTERKKIQDQLQQKENKFRTLFEMANDAILILRDGKFSDCNLRSETLFGCRKEDIIGRTPGDFSPPKQPDGRLSAEMVATHIQAAMNGQPQFFAQQALRWYRFRCGSEHKLGHHFRGNVFTGNHSRRQRAHAGGDRASGGALEVKAGSWKISATGPGIHEAHGTDRHSPVLSERGRGLQDGREHSAHDSMLPIRGLVHNEPIPKRRGSSGRLGRHRYRRKGIRTRQLLGASTRQG
jgi:PAS domain S-box-containing protein